MSIGPPGGLAIAEIIFYFFGLPVAVICAKKHGWGRTDGWIMLIILALVRLAGSIAELVALQTGNINAYIANLVLQNIGLTFLIGAMYGLLRRIHANITHGRIPARAFNPFALALMAAIILGAVGQSDYYNGDQTLGLQLAQAGALINIILTVIAFLLGLYTLTHIGGTAAGEHWFVYGILAVAPFLFVRALYSVLGAFFVNNGQFRAATDGTTITYAFMGILMEFIAFIIYMTVGLLAPERTRVATGKHMGASHDSEMQAGPGQQSGVMR